MIPFNNNKRFLKKRNTNVYISFLMLLLATAVTGCRHDRKSPGYIYVEDMMNSDAYETYDPNPNFPDGKTAQSSVEGTISRELLPYPYTKTPEGMQKAGENLTNPFDSTKEDIERGQREFNIYCSNCHGLDGKGEGLLYKSGKYPTEPASLVSTDMQKRPDGEFFHVITLGSAIMGAHASQVRRDDRWRIILYIKKVLQNNEIKAMKLAAADSLAVNGDQQ